MFAILLPMSPFETAKGGLNLTIEYSFASSPFGEVLVASTPKGICFMGFAEERTLAIDDMRKRLPNAVYVQSTNPLHRQAMTVFVPSEQTSEPIVLHVKGTDFQIRVWETLLDVPVGSIVFYQTIACCLESPRAVRAVGSAVGANPVSVIIPCHRVIRSDGGLGGYHWGETYKIALLEKEQEYLQL